MIAWEFHSANMSVCEEPSLAALLREWCPHSLSEETAPLLSELAASAAANLPDTDPARDDWVALQEECANTESSLAEDGNGSAPAPAKLRQRLMSPCARQLEATTLGA